ncbi:MAG: hypothetical protein O2916_09310 [Proteobacteria bacterium]|nr:hypothetical protein [Pseudomonadota bacterium]
MKKYIRAKSLAEALNISQCTIWRYAAAGIIPQPIRPTKRTSLFDVDATFEALEKINTDTKNNKKPMQ